MPLFQKKFHLKLVSKFSYLYFLDTAAQCFVYILFMDMLSYDNCILFPVYGHIFRANNIALLSTAIPLPLASGTFFWWS